MRPLGWLATVFMVALTLSECGPRPASAAPPDVAVADVASPLSDPERVVYAAIRASEKYGVELWLLICVAGHESRLATHKVGAAGEVGPVQLLEWGERRTFYRLGYADPRNPDEAMDFLARRISDGALSYWSTAGLCR